MRVQIAGVNTLPVTATPLAMLSHTKNEQHLKL